MRRRNRYLDLENGLPGSYLIPDFRKLAELRSFQTFKITNKSIRNVITGDLIRILTERHTYGIQK